LYGLTKIASAVWTRPAAGWASSLVAGVVNLLVGVVLGVQWPGLPGSAVPGVEAAGEMHARSHHFGLWAVAALVGVRLLSVGWAMFVAPPAAEPAPPPPGLHPDRRLKLPPHPEVARLESEVVAGDLARRG